MFRSWMKLATSTALLGFEAQEVIARRVAKLAKGGKAAQREAHLMVSEKVLAATEAALKAGTGASSHSLVAGYRKKVRANRRRLRKG